MLEANFIRIKARPLAADRKEEYGIFFGLIIHVLVSGIARRQ
jgi:hypothetical protein